jgi:hypothetical protein
MLGESMANYKTGLVITGDASGGIKAVRATDDELKKLSKGFNEAGKNSKRFENNIKQSSAELDLMSGIAKTAALSIGGLLAAGGFGNLFAGAIEESEKLQRNLLRTEQLIKTTGGAAGFSAKELHEQARELALATLQSTEGVMSAQQVLLSYTNIVGDNFTRAIETATDLSSLIDGNLNTSLEMLAKTLDDPIQGINAMRRQGIYFSESQKDVIKSLVETNRLADAQAIILDELAGQFGGVAKAEALRFGGAQDTLGQKIQEAKIEFAEQLKLLERSQSFYTVLAEGVVSVTENMDRLISVGQVLALAMGGKLAGSLSAVVAAKIAAQAQSIRYQATLASMAGVSASAAASQIALASSIAVANRALMLLGGPVGVAFLAAGSIYAFRNELGLTKNTSELTTDGISQVAHSIKTMDSVVINNNLNQLSADLQEVSLRATESRLRVSQLQSQLAAFGESGGDASDGSNMGAGHASQWSAEASRIASRLAAARKEVEAEEELIRKINESIDMLNNSPRRDVNSSSDSMQEVSKESKRLAEQGASYLQELARMRASELQSIEYWKNDSIQKLRSYNLTVEQIKDGEAMIIAEANQRVIDLENKKWDSFLDKSLSSLAKLRADAEMVEGPKGQLVQRSIGQQIAKETFNGLPGESYLGPEVGGASSEVDRLERERQLIIEAYNQRIEDYKLYREIELENKNIYDEQIIALEVQKNSIIEKADKAIADARLKKGAETFGSLSGLARAFGGEQSKAYKVLYGMQQGYTLASVLLSSADAIGKAWSSAPFPYNLPAVAITVAETGALQQMVSGISSPSFNGGGQTWQGPRSGGVDGIGGRYAIVHSDETIIDHTKPVPKYLKQVLLDRVFQNDVLGYVECPESSSIAHSIPNEDSPSLSKIISQRIVNNKSVSIDRSQSYIKNQEASLFDYGDGSNSLLKSHLMAKSFRDDGNSPSVDYVNSSSQANLSNINKAISITPLEFPELQRSEIIGNKNAVNLKINIVESRERSGEVQQRGDGEEREVDIFIADIYGDGKRSQAIQSIFGLTRQGF